MTPLSSCIARSPRPLGCTLAPCSRFARTSLARSLRAWLLGRTLPSPPLGCPCAPRSHLPQPLAPPLARPPAHFIGARQTHNTGLNVQAALPKSINERRVKEQIRTLLLPDLVARRQTEFVVDYAVTAFYDWYAPMMCDSEAERVRQCTAASG